MRPLDMIHYKIGSMANEHDKLAFERHCIGWMASYLTHEEAASMIESFDEHHVYGPPAGGSQNAQLILLNKAQTLRMEDREEFYRWLGATLGQYISERQARNVCRQWDEWTGEAWLEKLRRRVA